MLNKGIVSVLLSACFAVLSCPCTTVFAGEAGRGVLTGAVIQNTCRASLALCLHGNIAAPHTILNRAAAEVDPATPGEAGRGTGDFTVTGGTLGTDYRFEDHVLHILTGTPLSVSGTTVVDRIFVESGVNADITLKGVNIQIPDKNHVPAFEIAAGSAGNVTVTLADGTANILKSGMWCAGLQKDGSGTVGTLTLRCQKAGNAGHVCAAGCGSLTATGYWGAGIGSSASEDSKAHATKNITINGGNIHASSVTHGAGIGAGSMGTAENIAIRGGIVEAAGGVMGVGIGDSSSSHIVTISGGRVTAAGGSMSAAGSGQKSAYGIGGRLATADASGKPGNAYISAGSLADTAGQSAWSGVILVGKEGRVWGSAVKLPYSAEIPEGTVLTIPESSTLTVETGAVLSVKGKLRVDGTLAGAGQISGTDIRYRLTVKNGEASGKIDDGYVLEGAQIKLVPEKPASSSQVFSGWKCTPEDLKITGNQFCMPASPVRVEAQYERKQTSYTGHSHSYGDWNYDRSGHWRECYDCGRRGWYGAHTFIGWTSADGWRYEQCETCGYQVISAAYGSVIPGGAGAAGPGGSTAAGSVPGGSTVTQPGGNAGTGTTPVVVPGEQPGGGSAQTGSAENTTAAQNSGNTGSNAGTSVPAGTQPQKGTGSGGTSGSQFWGGSGSGAAAASKPQSGGSTGAGSGEEQKPSGTDDQQETLETEPSSSDVSAVVTFSPKEESSEEYGSGKPSNETVSGSAGAEDGTAASSAGQRFFERIPWWFWLFVFVGIAAAIITFAVLSERSDDGTAFEDDDDDIK